MSGFVFPNWPAVGMVLLLLFAAAAAGQGRQPRVPCPNPFEGADLSRWGSGPAGRRPAAEGSWVGYYERRFPDLDRRVVLRLW